MQGEVYAELSRYDGRNELSLNTFGKYIDLVVLEAFIAFARKTLEPFEDGAPWSEVRATQHYSAD